MSILIRFTPASLTAEQYDESVRRLEAAGGVERWSSTLRSDPELRDDLQRATAEQVEIRRSLAGAGDGRDGGAALELGIGGSRNPLALKCLHAHVAYALARPDYVLGEAVLAEVPERWPSACCTPVPSP